MRGSMGGAQAAAPRTTGRDAAGWRVMGAQEQTAADVIPGEIAVAREGAIRLGAAIHRGRQECSGPVAHRQPALGGSEA